jgi:flagellar basal-body rod modification protein FlgD
MDINSSLYSSLGVTYYDSTSTASTTSTTDEEQDSGALALEDFLSLMTTQLQNQDPLAPLENGDFLGQIASFAQVSGLDELQNSFSSFADSMKSDQALQGSALVGKSVLIPSSLGQHSAESNLSGIINVDPSVTDLSLQIFTEEGELVRTIEMGTASGNVDFTWDGLDQDGNAVDFGSYQFLATGTVDGEGTAFATATIAKVDSVLVGSDQGLVLNLAGIGAVPFSEAQEIL